MAGIREEITLIDRFSNTFDKFINMGNRAAAQASTVETATNKMAQSAETAYKKIGWVDPGSKGTAPSPAIEIPVPPKPSMANIPAESALNVAGQWRQQADAVEAAANRMYNAAAGASKSMDTLGEQGAVGLSNVAKSADKAAEAASNASKNLNNLSGQNSFGGENAAKAFEKAAESVNFYKKTLAEVEKELDNVNRKLYMSEVMPFGGRSQQKNVDIWRRQSDALEMEQNRLKTAIAAASGEANGLAPAIKNAVGSTQAMHNEFKNMAGTVMKITALLGGLYGAKKFIELGFKTDSYERMLQSRLGDQEVGSAAFQHYKGMADKNGFKYEDVMQGVMSFMGMTTKPQQLDALTLLAKRMAVFDTTGQGLKGAQFSLQEAMSGDFTSLHRRFNIGTAAIDASGVKTAAKAGDVDSIIKGLEKLFAMRNMSDEAFNNLMKSPQRQLETFENRWHNSMANMAQAVVLRMLPALTRLSDFLASPAGEQFMNALAMGIGFAASAILWLVNGFLALVQILEPFAPVLEVIFWTLLIMGAYAATTALWGLVAPLFAVIGVIAMGIPIGEAFAMVGWQAAAAWFSVNWPILTVIATVVVLLSAFLKFPETFGIVAGAVYAFGTVFINVLKGIGNYWISLFNQISSDLNKLSMGKINLGHVNTFEYGDPLANYSAGKAWGTEAATKVGNFLDGIKPTMPIIPTAPWDNFQGQNADIGNVGKVGKVGKIHEPVKLSNEDLKMLLDIADRDYVNKINITQLTPSVHVQVDTGGGNVDADGVAERIKHMLIEQSAVSTNGAYGG